MRCVQINAAGVVVDVVPQPAEIEACTLVLASPLEVGANPFNLTLEDAQQLAPAMILVLAVGAAWRAIIKATSSGDYQGNDNV